MIVIDCHKHILDLRHRHRFNRLKRRIHGIGIGADLPVKVLSLFVKHMIIGIKGGIKKKTVSRFSIPQIADILAVLCLFHLFRVFRNGLIAGFTADCLRHFYIGL